MTIPFHNVSSISGMYVAQDGDTITISYTDKQTLLVEFRNCGDYNRKTHIYTFSYTENKNVDIYTTNGEINGCNTMKIYRTYKTKYHAEIGDKSYVFD
jgi:hypothetical protein